MARCAHWKAEVVAPWVPGTSPGMTIVGLRGRRLHRADCAFALGRFHSAAIPTPHLCHPRGRDRRQPITDPGDPFLSKCQSPGTALAARWVPGTTPRSKPRPRPRMTSVCGARDSFLPTAVIPAKAGGQSTGNQTGAAGDLPISGFCGSCCRTSTPPLPKLVWVPAFAGMTCLFGQAGDDSPSSMLPCDTRCHRPLNFAL